MQSNHHKHFPYHRPFVFAQGTLLPIVTYIIRKNLNNYETKFKESLSAGVKIPSKQEYLSRQEEIRTDILASFFEDCPFINYKPTLNHQIYKRQSIIEDAHMQVQFARWNDDFHLAIIPSRKYIDLNDWVTGAHFNERDYIFWQNIYNRHADAAGGIQNVTNYLCDLVDTFKEGDCPESFKAAYGFDPRTVLDNACILSSIQNCIYTFHKLPDHVAADYIERYVAISEHIESKFSKFTERVYAVHDNDFINFKILNSQPPKTNSFSIDVGQQ